MQFQVAPSLLAADFLHLEDEVRKVNRSGDILHLDVMDGTLVPNISFGFSVIEAVAPVCTVPMDAHLMVVEPQLWFERLAALGVQMCSFHLEAAGERTAEFIDRIHELGMKAGVAINPDVPVESLFPYVGKADWFLLMSVFAGFGGQKFIPATLGRVRELKAEIAARGFNTPVQIDGGVCRANVGEIKAAGVDIAVAGSAVFSAPDPEAAVAALRQG